MPGRLRETGAWPGAAHPASGMSGHDPTGKERLPATNAMASGLAGRYATALFELASERGELDRVEADLTDLEQALDGSPELGRMLRSPVAGREEQGQAMAALAERLSSSETTRGFLGVLAQKRRLAALPDVARQFKAMLAERRGEETAEVVSAVPLAPAQLDELKASLAKRAGRAVNLTASVDPDLMGGLVVRLGSRMIDASLKTKLQQLELSMRGVR